MTGMSLGEKPWRDIKPDAQAFDEIRIITVPRFKESGLTGNEWRISANVQFMRKGRVIVERTYRNIETACNYLAAAHGEACEGGNAMYGGEGDFCDQEGCAEMATVTYQKKADYCREGHKSELRHITVRKFCERHKHRGDCGLDDADQNYEPWEGSTENTNAQQGLSGGGIDQSQPSRNGG